MHGRGTPCRGPPPRASSRSCSHCCSREPRMPDRFDAVRALMLEGVESHVFPAACIDVGRSDGSRWCAAVGALTYDPYAAPATPATIFDLASLTKVLASATLGMR